ncbi:PdxA family dehydrogenase [Paenibacillus radicis (ex Xue et al. 2023)]|uniref:4-hydroxythreonine-4-phosphate dehydrogenase PdxA n=1 Tax=Paenibacillus radicis (ex Xue et al. 2023) TaxID=2972489 RepID=A0ABT1YSC8_9BACL|nr:4-hydroxythreonine-4-phosphate dehydrogenase PdxA [Paenibacillus radicis (ex Xue et al. 2023)]MCR8635203.1 4-hydroxythreonine-4-phosphate dehydrogenase PdxA [Paenibacillus radicis (ex Xue et al. 2023)]
MKRKPLMGLTLGDATGIGSELVAKTLESEDIRRMATWVVVGDERVFQQGLSVAGVTLPYQTITNIEEVERDDQVYFIDLHNLQPDAYTLGRLSAESGQATGETLTYVLKLAQQKKLDGVVYAPINKEALHSGGFHFQDELHFFASLLDCKEGFSEINVMGDLWVTRITSHVPIKQVSSLVTKERVARIIRFAHDTLINVGYDKPKIAVAALNPHAGDGGLLGTEEIDEIRPAIYEAQEQGIHVEGPYPADTIFLRLKTKPFDCLVSMYHDQAQTGMKLLGFNKGVTVSGGLPVVITTPAHGTAFDIAGQGIADPGATEQAMRLAIKLAGF